MSTKDNTTTTSNFLEALDQFATNVETTEQMFFVYFNNAGNIVCMSPVADDSLTNFQFTMLPLSEVQPFIEGTKNPAQFLLEQDKDDPTKYTVVSKVIEINYLRRLDRFLIELEPSNDWDGHLIIHNNISEKCITFSLSSELRMKLSEQGTIAPENITINGIPELDFHFTCKNDPSFLIETIVVPTNNLVGYEHIYVNYENDLSKASVFTRKIFNKYSYIITNNEK